MRQDISAEDFCIACGHYHNPEARAKGRECIVAVGAKDCSCTVKTFVPRSFKRKF